MRHGKMVYRNAAKWYIIVRVCLLRSVAALRRYALAQLACARCARSKRSEKRGRKMRPMPSLRREPIDDWPHSSLLYWVVYRCYICSRTI